MSAYVYCDKCDYTTKVYAIVEVINEGGKYTNKHNNDRCPKCKSLNSLKQSK